MQKVTMKSSGSALLVTLAIAVLVSLVTPSAGSGGTSFDPTGKVRFEAAVGGGAGSDEIDVAVTTTDEIISISGGGGPGFGVEVGYCPSSSVEIGGSVGYQVSGLSEKVANADGSFDRTFLRGTVKYRIPVSPSGVIKVGAGGGYYLAGDLDLEMSKVPNGHHDIFTYNSAPGFHVGGEYERYISSWSSETAGWSWGIGIRYYSVTYDLDSMTRDGMSIPLSLLKPVFKEALMELAGSGFDVFVQFALYR